MTRKLKAIPSERATMNQVALRRPIDDARARAGRLTGRRIGACLLFLASFVIVSVGLGYVFDDRTNALYRGWLSEKLYVLRHTDPRPNVVFIGASSLLRAVDPEIVDQAAAAHGCEVRSVNLGMPGAHVYELSNMIDHVLDADLAGSLVVYDSISALPQSFSQIHTYLRFTAAEKLTYTADLYDVIPTLGERVVVLARYLRAALSEALGIHLLSDALFMEAATPERLRWPWIERRGYVAKEDSPNHPADQEDFLRPEAQADNARRLKNWDPEEFRKKNDPLQRPNPFAERIRAAGLHPVIFAVPYKTPELALAAQTAVEADPDLAAIVASKENLPEVYADIGLWYDAGHLAKPGAKITSEYIGKELCRIIRRQ